MAIFNSYVSLPEGNGDVDHLSTAAGFRWPIHRYPQYPSMVEKKHLPFPGPTWPSERLCSSRAALPSGFWGQEIHSFLGVPSTSPKTTDVGNTGS